MDAKSNILTPADQLARDNPVRIPNESADYRAARTALLAGEIELRRQMERVAAQRRALPPGGPVTGDYRFEGEEGPTDFEGLFGDKQTLVIYSYMFGPQRERPCPMCTNLLGAWEANAADIGQKSLAGGRRPLADRQLTAWKHERGWKHLRLFSDLNDNYSRDYFGVLPDGSEIRRSQRLHPPRRDRPPLLVGRDDRRDRRSRPGRPGHAGHLYATVEHAGTRTPEGREPGWYPKLDY